MEIVNIIIYTLGILAVVSGIALGLKRGYEFLRNYMQGRKVKSKQLERARFVKDVRTEVRKYLEELQS